MTMMRARNTGPTSQAISLMPATAITAAAMPSSMMRARGRPPDGLGADRRRRVPLVDGATTLALGSSSGAAGSDDAVTGPACGLMPRARLTR